MQKEFVHLTHSHSILVCDVKVVISFPSKCSTKKFSKENMQINTFSAEQLVPLILPGGPR